MNTAMTIYDKYFDSNKSENRLGQAEAMAIMDCKDYYMERHYKVFKFHDGSTLVFTYDDVRVSFL